MAPQDLPSNIRVFVRWHEPTVFAGEEIKCTITFKNVAQTPREAQQQQQQQHQVSPLHRKAGAANLTPPASASRNLGHRSAQSLSVPQPLGSRSRRQSGSSTAATPTATAWHPGALVERSPPAHTRGHNHHPVHNRSLSVVSARSTAHHELAGASASRTNRPHRGHGRATSLQIPVKRASTLPEAPLTAGEEHCSGTRRRWQDIADTGIGISQAFSRRDT